MEEKKEGTDSFQFRMDEVSPDAVLREDQQDSRINKLGRKLILMAVLIPCVIGVVLFFLYLDLKKRVVQGQDVDSKTFQNLSRDIDSRSGDLLSRLEAVESALANRDSEIEKRIDSVKFRLYKAENRIKNVNKAKADKESQQAMAENLEKLSTQLAGLNTTFSENFDDITAGLFKVRQDVTKLQVDVTTLVKEKIDRQTLAEEISRGQQKQEEKLTTLSGNMNKRFQAIQKDLEALESQLASVRRSGQPPQSSAPAPTPRTQAGPPSTGSTSQSPAEDIVEKDLN
jgi:DNA repair exonuclease SbcCD ATPase subunit